jgi:hypothetical protein
VRARLAALRRSPERLLPFACVAAALVLFASELMTTFEFTPPGGEPLCTQDAIDRHAFAPALLAMGAIVATGIAVFAGSKPAAVGVAVCGVVALAIFLLLDLPDANQVGAVDESCGPTAGTFFNAEALPRPGFWLELVGSLALVISGGALASLTPEQLGALRPRPRSAPGTLHPAEHKFDGDEAPGRGGRVGDEGEAARSAVDGNEGSRTRRRGRI